jgi:antitoxin VapB
VTSQPATITSRRAEVDEKLERVRSFLDDRDLGGALFTGQNVVAWITAGLEDPIVRGTDPGLVWALITPDGAYLITQNVEGPRLLAEESTDELGFEVVQHPWPQGDGYESAVGELCEPSRLATDGAGPGTDMSLELQLLRLELTEGERDRMRALGADGCAALEAAARSLTPGMGEHELAAELVANLERARIFPSVLLVGGDERRRSFRHPSVSSTPIQRDAMAVIVGVRGGLNLAATRSVSLGASDPELAERHRVACQVEAAMIEASRPGATYGDALGAGVAAYAELGYPGEERHHLQGAAIGYGPREFSVAPPATPNRFTGYEIAVNQAFA